MADPAIAPPTLEEAKGMVGWSVDEVGGDAIALVHGFFSDAGSRAPTWLIAKQGGRFARNALVAVPLADCAAGAGRIWVGHSGKTIRSAPVVDPTRPLLREHELTICAHYGIGKRVGRAAEVAGRDEGAVTSQPAA